MISKLLRKLTDISDGGKHLPWITRKVMVFISGFDYDKYWKRFEAVTRPELQVNPILKAYYLLWIKRQDAKHCCSFGASFNHGAALITPPICLMVRKE